MSGFTAIPNTVIRDRRLTMTTRILFGVILSYSFSPENPCRVSAKELSEICGIGRTAFFDAITQMKEFGLLEVRKERHGSGWQNVYVPLVRGVVFEAPDGSSGSRTTIVGSSGFRTGGSSGLEDAPRARTRNHEEDERSLSEESSISMEIQDAPLARWRVKLKTPEPLKDRLVEVWSVMNEVTGKRWEMTMRKDPEKLSSFARNVLDRIEENPTMTTDQHRLMLTRVMEHDRYWEKKGFRLTPNVFYGENAFEFCRDFVAEDWKLNAPPAPPLPRGSSPEIEERKRKLSELRPWERNGAKLLEKARAEGRLP